MPLIEKRYASALVDSAKGELSDYLKEFSFIKELYQKDEDFRMLLQSPEINSEIKKDILKKVFEGKIKKELLNLLLVTVDKNRIKNLPKIYDEFEICVNKIRNVINIEVFSAFPLEEEQLGKIKEKYLNIYKAKEANVSVTVEKELLGGIVVKIGDMVYDGSLKGRIKDLWHAMSNN